jgi:IS4 transposase
MANPDLKRLLNHPNREFFSLKNWQKFLAPINQRILVALIQKYQSDKWVKTLFTQNILNLYLFIGLTIGKTVTLRMIEIISHSAFARFFTGLTHGFSRSGLSDRHQAIPADLFRDLLYYLVQQAGPKGKKLIKEAKDRVKIFDATFISLAHKLIPWACQSVNQGLVSLTLRINEGSWLPDRIILTNQPSDHTLFADLIDWQHQGITYLFDRGFSNFDVLNRIIASRNCFITRLPTGYVYKVLKCLKIKQPSGGKITILSDQQIRVGGETRPNKFVARLITVINDQNEKLYFLTNRFDLTAWEVCEIYRQRWQIEILFKWLKSQLKINRVIAYGENGFYLQIYMGLILHVLIMLYRQRQHLTTHSLLEIYRTLQSWVYDFWGYSMLMLGVSIGPPYYFSNLKGGPIYA